MSRRARWEESRKRGGGDHPTRRKIPAWQWVLIVGLPLAFLPTLAACLISLARSQQGEGTGAIERELFRKAVVGKTADEIIETMGTPKSTRDNSHGGLRSFLYANYTYDRITGRTDSRAWVYFDRNGRCESVSFSP